MIKNILYVTKKNSIFFTLKKKENYFYNSISNRKCIIFILFLFTDFKICNDLCGYYGTSEHDIGIGQCRARCAFLKNYKY